MPAPLHEIAAITRVFVAGAVDRPQSPDQSVHIAELAELARSVLNHQNTEQRSRRRANLIPQGLLGQ